MDLKEFKRFGLCKKVWNTEDNRSAIYGLSGIIFVISVFIVEVPWAAAISLLFCGISLLILYIHDKQIDYEKEFELYKQKLNEYAQEREKQKNSAYQNLQRYCNQHGDIVDYIPCEIDYLTYDFWENPNDEEDLDNPNNSYYNIKELYPVKYVAAFADGTIFFANNLYKSADLLSVETKHIVTEGTSNHFRNTSKISTDTGSLIGRTAVGAIVGGVPGAIIGASSASKTIEEDNFDIFYPEDSGLDYWQVIIRTKSNPRNRIKLDIDNTFEEPEYVAKDIQEMIQKYLNKFSV